MKELTQPHLPASKVRRQLVLRADRGIVWLATHWLAVVNGFLIGYVGLPFLAPILLAYDYTTPANAIYMLYSLDCHQLPSRSYFIAGKQVAFCHRHVSMYGSLLLGGLLFPLVRQRLRPPALRWYVFFLVPIALDAGMQMASEWLQFMPMTMLWAIGLIAMGITSAILHSRNYLTWHSYLYFASEPLALIYLHYFGPYQSNWLLRTLTGFIFGFGTVWFAYPHLEERFNKIQQKVSAKSKIMNGALEEY